MICDVDSPSHNEAMKAYEKLQLTVGHYFILLYVSSQF